MKVIWAHNIWELEKVVSFVLFHVMLSGKADIGGQFDSGKRIQVYSMGYSVLHSESNCAINFGTASVTHAGRSFYYDFISSFCLE